MSPLWERLLRPLPRALLSGASILVPRHERVEWLREWHAELWHVRKACTPANHFSWAGEQEVLAFCLGAFQDALCLRQYGSQRANNLGASESPELCILCLAVLLSTFLAAALLLPGVRAVQALSTPEFAPGLVLIYDAGANNDEPTISSGQYRAWKRLRQHYFDAFAFYMVTQEAVGQEPD